jgi:Holliday junction resolvase RusA-like endonuclease
MKRGVRMSQSMLEQLTGGNTVSLSRTEPFHMSLHTAKVPEDPVAEGLTHPTRCGSVMNGRGFSLVVRGTPKPQGSKKFVGMDQKTRRPKMVEASEIRPWRKAIYVEARYAKRGAPFEGPLRVRMVFTVARNKEAVKTNRERPHCKPDLSKYARAVEDALTDAGVWHDDGQVVEYSRLAKVFPRMDPEAMTEPGVRILVEQL